MNDPTLNRRDLHRLVLAGLGGLAAGLLPGCGSKNQGPPPSSNPGDKTPGLLLDDTHVCRGINTCKNKGGIGMNDCAGQGHCHKAKAHDCQGQNACRGQGGCNGKDIPGMNECKGQGACKVPLSTDPKKNTWKLARDRFEQLMKEKFPDKKVGPAPES